jgi:hypothetical protein
VTIIPTVIQLAVRLTERKVSVYSKTLPSDASPVKKKAEKIMK